MTALTEINQDNLFVKYNGALLFTGMPHETIVIDVKCLYKHVIDSKSLFARYYTDSQLLNGGGYLNPELDKWWHCLRQEPIFLSKLNSKQRYRIKRGLNLNEIKMVSSDEVRDNIEEFQSLLEDSFSDYPKVYKPRIDYKEYAESFIQISDSHDSDVWFVFDKLSRKLIGMSVCKTVNSAVNLLMVKVNPQYNKNEVNAALGFSICEHYLNHMEAKYICDGKRNIRHKSNYQDFLIRVLGFKYVPCKLHIIYHPLVRPIVLMLYPLRGFIQKIEMTNRLLYNISCALKQEEIARFYR